jgi:UDP-glucose 4-epimerase
VLFVGNLVDAIVRALDHPAATGRTFNVADVPDVSTPGLITAIATALHRRPRLLPCPVPILRAAAAVVGRSDELNRLVDDMAVDTSRIRAELGWRPSVALNGALARSLPVAQGGREGSG